ncbi:hypothetical protein REPUB_Repub09cG0096000 [Reevesia pubescens]
MAELNEAIWDCNGFKALGLDSFNFSFFKKCWRWLEEELMDFISYFHLPGSLKNL